MILQIPELNPELPERVSVDGLKDSKRPSIEYWGVATRQANGRYICLANVDGLLCQVEVTISPEKV
jgi:hypothetical protein